MSLSNNRRQGGFTLLEIVITLVITAILSAVVIQAIGGNVQRSTAPLTYVRGNLSLQQVMENITADYKALMLTDTTPMVTFVTRIAQNNTTDGPYWTPATAFNGQTTGIAFTSVGACETYVDCFQESGCASNCAVYRITITRNDTGQSLSALFVQ